MNTIKRMVMLLVVMMFVPVLIVLSHIFHLKWQLKWDVFAIWASLDWIVRLAAYCWRPAWFQWKIFYPLAQKIHKRKWSAWERCCPYG